MPRKTLTEGSLALASFEDIFSTGTAAVQTGGEQITFVPVADLYPPEFHPFQVNDDEAMTRLAESVREYGVREPGIARPRPSGGYELICGNRRKRACELAGVEEMPVIVREMSDDLAAIVMVDSNLERREKILPSERAWAYRVMMEALNHSGVKGGSHSHEIMAERTGTKKSQIFRIIRLTELTVTLLDMVDSNQLAFNPAVELSYLSVKEQAAVAEAMKAHEAKPSLSQATRLKKMKQDGRLTVEGIGKILSEEKKPPKGGPAGGARYRHFFPPEYSPKQIDEVITRLLKEWQSKKAMQQKTT